MVGLQGIGVVRQRLPQQGEENRIGGGRFRGGGLGQARRETERLCRLAEARRLGVKSGPELVAALGLGPRQAFLMDGYARVLGRIGPDGATRLLALVNQTDLDLKGQAISRSPTPLVNLTTSLCRAWSS